MVFQDYFDGNTLKAPWITFHSWDGMYQINPITLDTIWGDHENWGEGRCVTPYNAIDKDYNIEVSNGTVKLNVKKEAASWHCATCAMSTRNTNYTTSCLRLPYTRSFNAGKFEARLKMPTFKFAHSTFWLWEGNAVNEIDIAEAYGWTGNSGLFGYIPKCDYSLHAWEPGNTPATNPYNMTHVEVMNRYPRQTWWDWQRGKYFKQDDFHTYTCEWDTAIIRFYLDGDLLSEQWKYYQDRSETKGFWPFRHTVHYRVGSGCNPDPGTWHIMQGFPYNNHSESALNFTPGLDQDNTYANNTVLGAMEIDYVKIWEKHPENGWSDLCDPGANTTVSGPDIICNTGTYTASPVSPGGHWFVSNSNLTVLSSNNATATIQKNSTATNFAGYIYYSPIDNTCPNPNGNLALKRIDVGVPNQTQVVCAETHSLFFHTLHYNLHADPNTYPTPIPYFSPTTFEWFVDYGPGYSQSYHAYGQFISTPTISYTSGSTTPVRWTLKVTNGCGTVTKTGQMSYYLMKRVPTEQSDKDPNNIYAVADIPDVDAYNQMVEKRMSQTFIDVNADETARNEVFEKIQMEELEPYILLDSADINKVNLARKTNGTIKVLSETKIYPNPSSKFVNIELSQQYQTSEPVQIMFFNMFGDLKKQSNQVYNQGDILNVDISELSNGLYNIELQQKAVVEHFKILKQ